MAPELGWLARRIAIIERQVAAYNRWAVPAVLGYPITAAHPVFTPAPLVEHNGVRGDSLQQPASDAAE